MWAAERECQKFHLTQKLELRSCGGDSHNFLFFLVSHFLRLAMLSSLVERFCTKIMGAQSFLSWLSTHSHLESSIFNLLTWALSSSFVVSLQLFNVHVYIIRPHYSLAVFSLVINFFYSLSRLRSDDATNQVFLTFFSSSIIQLFVVLFRSFIYSSTPHRVSLACGLRLDGFEILEV